MSGDPARRKPARRNVEAAARRIAGLAVHTPLLHSPHIDALSGRRVLFKCENLQRSGSFKFRGAANAVLSLSARERQRGVVTHSSGNHGAALAAIAQQLDIPATVIVPRGGSAYKRAQVRRFGARLVDCGATLAARERALARHLAASGAAYIPPYDHPAIVAGQGTVALEIAQDVVDVCEIWVPVGGGGLASGLVVAVGQRVQVMGAEPELAGDACASLHLGVRQPPMPPRTIADGLRTSLGELNFALLNAYRLPIELVSESQIRAAQKLAMNELNVLVEPSAAVPLAALLARRPCASQRGTVVVVLTGGNLDAAPLVSG